MLSYRLQWMGRAVGLVSVLGCVACQRPQQEAKAARPGTEQKAAQTEAKRYLVGVSPVQATTLVDQCTLPGTLKVWEKVTLSAEASGQVEQLNVDEGSKVKAGDLIALIDAEALRTEFEASQVQFEEAKKSYDRLEQLFKLKNVTENDLDKARTGFRVAESRFKVAKIMLDKSEVRSPVDGEVNQKEVEPGEFLNRGQPICEIVILDPLKLVVSVPEKDIGSIREGMEAVVSLDSVGLKDLAGRVHQIALTGDEKTNTFPVEVEIRNAERTLKPGMIGRATFIKKRLENVVAMPLFAVVTRNERHLAFVVEGQKARMREVTLGVVDGDQVQIVDGIQPGDQVIVEGGRDLDDGAEIEILPQQGTAEGQR